MFAKEGRLVSQKRETRKPLLNPDVLPLTPDLWPV
jgi:hypothetical protein